MNRRRLFYVCTTLVLIGGGVAAWFVFAHRDADFHIIGLKTPRIRANYALLDTKIEVAEFQDCKTLNQAMLRLNEKFFAKPTGPRENPFMCGFLLDPVAFAQQSGTKGLTFAPVQFTAHPPSDTLKQFMRDIFQQAGLKDAHFIVTRYGFEATTLSQVQAEQARYLESVSLFDRVHNAWKEITGQIEDDSIWLDLIQSEVK